MTAPAFSSPGALPDDTERALMIERIRFLFSIGPNEMFPLDAAARSTPRPPSR